MHWNRRQFLKFMGLGGASIAALSPLGCQLSEKTKKASVLPFQPLTPHSKDIVICAPGFEQQILISRGDSITSELFFGDHNDYTCFFPINASEAILWVNHEYLNPTFISGWNGTEKRTKQQVLQEMPYVGGSLLHLKKSTGANFWQVVFNHPHNRRIDAFTAIPFSGGISIDGSKQAIGSMANCAGGKTPWKTVLTCEENYDMFFGEIIDWTENNRKIFHPGNTLQWSQFFPRTPLHYGWVVEVDPFTGTSKKLVSLGRFRHECATVVTTQKGFPVVYMGDDRTDECLYKFIGDQKNSLDSGTLYVANFEEGRWLPLVWEKSKILQKYFKNQIEVLLRVPEAAKLLGGTALERPEDIEIDPRDGSIYACLTGVNARKSLGRIIKINEENNQHESLRFSHSTFLTGGKDGFANPDNLVFDKRGNLWMTSDISGSRIGHSVYESFQHNGLFYIPMSGPHAGQVLQVASAPNDAEFTGPCFSDDGMTLFVSVQHPGESSPHRDRPTSQWPRPDKAGPKSSVIMLSGDAMQKLMS